jgi:hypothetical protein
MLARLLSALALEDEDGTLVASAASARARKAAASRWAMQAANRGA